jgi:hypothetical protein
MQRILTSLYWWNPFVYSISAGFSISREEVSDNYAIEGLKNPRLYAKNLLNLAEKTRLVSWLPATAGMAGPHFSLEDRVRNILTKGRNIGTKLNPNWVFFLVMGSLILASGAVGLKGSFDLGVSTAYGFKKTAHYYIKDTPGQSWKEVAFEFNNQYGFHHKSGKANIAVGKMVKDSFIKRAVNEGILQSETQKVDLSFFYQMWLEERSSKYRWKDVMITNEGKTTVNGNEAYWVTFDYARAEASRVGQGWFENFDYTRDSSYLKNKMGLKGKIYFIEGNQHCFRIWLRGAKETFDDVIDDFERYIETFEIIS